MNKKRYRPLLLAVAVLLAVSLFADAGKASAAETNSALSLRWAGYADLGASFSTFFGSDHTLAARFFPQYSHTYRGPILTGNDSSGSFLVGQGDYREDTNGDKLVLSVAGTTRTYLVPGGWQRRWYHLAVRREHKGFNYLSGLAFDLYLDGQRLCADPMLYSCTLMTPVSIPTPGGSLRVGRIGATETAKEQFYGLVDDVAVFSRALSQEEIQTLAASPRLTGAEPGLTRGFSFDGSPSSSCFWNWKKGIVFCGYKVAGDAHRKYVSPNRDAASDIDRLSPPAFHWSHGASLPFKPGQKWLVTQGYDQTGSHNGTAIFSLDFTLVGPSTPGKPMHKWNTSGESCGEPLFAIADGNINEVNSNPGWVDPKKNPPPDPNVDYDGPNYVRLRLEPNLAVVYLHVFSGSVEEAFPDMLFFPSLSYPEYAFAVGQGTLLARVGTRNGCHLHLAAGSYGGPPAAPDKQPTVPIGFWSYEACDANCGSEANWYYVPFGVPKDDQYVRSTVKVLAQLVSNAPPVS